ncbi:MAG: CAP domain-containing protein [Leptothrix sp. (in: b-proteobacteria)]
MTPTPPHPTPADRRGPAAVLRWALVSTSSALLLACGGGGSEATTSSTSSTSTTSTTTPASTVTSGGGASGASSSVPSTGSTGATGGSSSGGAVSPSAVTADCGLANVQADLLAGINAQRAQPQSCGATPYPATGQLIWNSRLYAAAAGHSTDMAANNYFSHTSLDGRTFVNRIVATGYTYRGIGENLGKGQASVTAVLAAWLASPGHCVNLMQPLFTEVGLACVRDSAGVPYWSLEFGQPL